tara:strand:- start:4871 stop:5065 length:195 start_codon:yes stop_codon:yes gene_type:complete
MTEEHRQRLLRQGKKPVMIQFTSEQHSEIKQIADRNNRTMAGQVRQWCDDGIVKEDPAYRAYKK